MTKYCIAWVSDITEAQGRGEGVYDYATAKMIADSMNNSPDCLPFMRHMPAPVSQSPPDPPAPPRPTPDDPAQ